MASVSKNMLPARVVIKKRVGNGFVKPPVDFRLQAQQISSRPAATRISQDFIDKDKIDAFLTEWTEFMEWIFTGACARPPHKEHREFLTGLTGWTLLRARLRRAGRI